MCAALACCSLVSSLDLHLLFLNALLFEIVYIVLMWLHQCILVQNEQIWRFLCGQESSAASKHPQQLHGSAQGCAVTSILMEYLDLCACLLRSSMRPSGQSWLSAWKRAAVVLMLIAFSACCSLSISGSSVGPQELLDWVEQPPALSAVGSHDSHPHVHAVVPPVLGACSTQARWLLASRFPHRLTTGGLSPVRWACATSSCEAIAYASHACHLRAATCRADDVAESAQLATAHCSKRDPFADVAAWRQTGSDYCLGQSFPVWRRCIQCGWRLCSVDSADFSGRCQCPCTFSAGCRSIARTRQWLSFCQCYLRQCAVEQCANCERSWRSRCTHACCSTGQNCAWDPASLAAQSGPEGMVLQHLREKQLAKCAALPKLQRCRTGLLHPLPRHAPCHRSCLGQLARGNPSALVATSLQPAESEQHRAAWPERWIWRQLWAQTSRWRCRPRSHCCGLRSETSSPSCTAAIATSWSCPRCRCQRQCLGGRGRCSLGWKRPRPATAARSGPLLYQKQAQARAIPSQKPAQRHSCIPSWWHCWRAPSRANKQEGEAPQSQSPFYLPFYMSCKPLQTFAVPQMLTCRCSIHGSLKSLARRAFADISVRVLV